MIDATLLEIIPPIAAAILTYFVASKRSRVQHVQLLADIQTKAIEQVRLAEEKMRAEVWVELDKVRHQNDELKVEIEEMRKQLNHSAQLRLNLTEQVSSLEHLVDTYKMRIVELEKKQ